MYTLDTNIIIALFQGDDHVDAEVRAWQRDGTPLITSAITLTELLSFPRITASEERRLKEFLLTTRVVPVSWSIAELAALVRRTYKLKIADSIIAATAWHEASTLVTRNVRDFRPVKEVEVQVL